MKKWVLAATALVLGLGVASAAVAATTADVYVHVYVVTGAVAIERVSAADVYFAGQILAGSTTRTAIGTSFRNSGDTISNWSISATNFPAWTLVTGAPAAINQARLSSIFADIAYTPVNGDYLADDVVTNTPTACSASQFAITTDNNVVKGFNVLPSVGASRYLYLRLDAPIAGSANLVLDQVSTLTVTAASAI